MPGLSRFSAQALFDRTLNPSTRLERGNYLALHKASLDDETYGFEADFTGYIRQALNSMYSQVSASIDGEVVLIAKNGSLVTFPASGGPTNLVTHWAIWDVPTVGEGNVLYSGALVASRLVEYGDSVIVRANEVVINFI